MMFVIRRLQELVWKKRSPLCVFFIDLTKTYHSVDRTLLWTALARFGVPQIGISVICQLHAGMRACVRLDDGVCLGLFAVEQGLCQGCVLAPLLFNICFAAVINVAYTHFKANKDIMDALGHALRRRCRSRLAIARAPEEDDRRDHGRVRGIWLTVSEAKTEIMCSRTKGKPEATAICNVGAASQVYNQTNGFVYLGGNADLSIKVDATHGPAFGSTPSNCTTDRALPSSSKSGC